jgi:predicted nucleotidyltransferase component of viral defense system
MTLYNYDKVFLGRKAKELGFNRDTLEKVTRLYDILRFMNTMPLLKKNLALKGGTAINFTMLDLPRLSVDIDLDFVNNCKKEEMLDQRKAINDAIHKYMTREGYELSPKSKSPHSLDSFVYRYIGVRGNNDNIKIEINYSLRAHIDQTEHVQAIHPLFTNDFKIHRLSIIEVFASKINALMTRAASRDLYDVYNMIKYNLIKDESLIHFRKSIILYYVLTTRNEDKAFNIETIDSINERMVKRDLMPVISKRDSFNLEEAQKEVKKYILKILTFTENEEKFIGFFNNNKFEPSLLFDDTQVLKRIENHPMALWRTRKTI